MKYKHIFFDLDRTLWDFEHNMRLTLMDIFDRHNLSNYAPGPEHFIETFNLHNDRLWNSYQNGELKKKVLRYKRFEKTLGDYGIRNKDLVMVIDREYIDESPKKTVLIPHSIEVLEYLKNKYKLHIITNGFNEVQFAKIELCGISHYFTKVVTSEMSGHHKPHPKAFGYTVSLANARKEESVMIGDDYKADIIGAKSFGIDQIYFNPTQTKQAQKATFEITSLLELLKIL
ncbi:MAG TPA: noncanonical pyrimidine nucleotidase, YjjG family [Bacteroidales bacterium]|jgi:putative hydrolase of the HAD superfamily|nr:noncanonical pyrimidine nucleotidase, YjjG family [Bacteroidales bacterium]